MLLEFFLYLLNMSISKAQKNNMIFLNPFFVAFASRFNCTFLYIESLQKSLQNFIKHCSIFLIF